MDGIDAVFKWRASRWKVRCDHIFVQLTSADLEKIAGWAKDGKLKSVIGKTEDE
jgi:hypothetical protein